MTIDEIKKWMLESSGFPVTQANAEYLERFQAIAFKAGAASRDAAIERYDVALLQVRKALCGDIHNTDDLLDLIERLQSERNQLRAQINKLCEALDAAATSLETIKLRSYGDESNLNHMDQVRGFAGSRARVAKESIASTPEQSLAEYRNKVIEAFVNEFSRHVGGDGEFWLHELQDFAMKEQP